MAKTQNILLLSKLGVKFCFNEQKYDYSKLKFIIVGDNPGNLEYQTNRFFIGPSGQELRRHFSENRLTNNFEEECIVFNKSYLHTSKTIQLELIKALIGTKLFEQIQEECAIEIATLANELQLPILIFGKSQLRPNLLFDAFWKKLNQEVINHELILVYNHPAPPYLKFKEEWDNYLMSCPILNNKELLFKIGQTNTLKINQLFKNY